MAIHPTEARPHKKERNNDTMKLARRYKNILNEGVYYYLEFFAFQMRRKQ